MMEMEMDSESKSGYKYRAEIRLILSHPLLIESYNKISEYIQADTIPQTMKLMIRWVYRDIYLKNGKKLPEPPPLGKMEASKDRIELRVRLDSKTRKKWLSLKENLPATKYRNLYGRKPHTIAFSELIMLYANYLKKEGKI